MDLAGLRAQRDEILRIAARHGARNVRVFGSVARGETTETSDVDLLVDVDESWSLLRHGEVVGELSELLGCPVDVAPVRMLRARVRKAALDEAIPL